MMRMRMRVMMIFVSFDLLLLSVFLTFVCFYFVFCFN